MVRHFCCECHKAANGRRQMDHEVKQIDRGAAYLSKRREASRVFSGDTDSLRRSAARWKSMICRHPTFFWSKFATGCHDRDGTVQVSFRNRGFSCGYAFIASISRPLPRACCLVLWTHWRVSSNRLSKRTNRLGLLEDTWKKVPLAIEASTRQ